MMSFQMMPAAWRSAVLILLFLLLVFQMVVCCIQFSEQSKDSKWNLCISGTLATVSLALLCFLAEGEKDLINHLDMWELTRSFLDVPIWVIAEFLAVASGISIWMFCQGINRMRNQITRGSIRESADFLPAGLCFSWPDGQPLLVNRKMEELSHLLCGESLQNGEKFWKNVCKDDLGEKAYRSRLLDVPALVLPDGTAWVFERQMIELEGKPLVQMTASNVTELYQLTRKVREENAVLRSMNARLKVYGRKVEDLARTQERLSMKVRIHDSIGQNLLATRHLLSQEDNMICRRSAEQILQKWRRSVAMLKQESEPEKPAGALKYLVDAARSAGVNVKVDGEFPQTGAAAELIVAAGAEALTNAVRHGEAKTLWISVSQTDLVYRVSFTNDGKVPAGALQEGGGLSGLRRRIEAAGGTMAINGKPEYMLTVTIPREGKVDVI